MPRRNTQTIVAKLQRATRRSSAPAVVDNTVDNAWIALGYAAPRPASACFACAFRDPFLCMKKPLRTGTRPTMLGAHQALEHKI
jgi:hypothetical protein